MTTTQHIFRNAHDELDRLLEYPFQVGQILHMARSEDLLNAGQSMTLLAYGQGYEEGYTVGHRDGVLDGDEHDRIQGQEDDEDD